MALDPVFSKIPLLPERKLAVKFQFSPEMLAKPKRITALPLVYEVSKSLCFAAGSTWDIMQKNAFEQLDFTPLIVRISLALIPSR